MVVILGVALLASFMFLLAGVTNALIVLADDHIPTAGPLRRFAVTRAARREAATLDAEYRELLRHRSAP